MMEPALVIDLPFELEALNTIAASVETLSKRLRYSLQKQEGEPVKEEIRRWRWTDALVPEREIRLVADRHQEVLYMLVYGEGREKIIAALKELLPVWKDDLDENDDKWLYRRALQSPQYSPALHKQILNCLKSSDTEKRQLALECISALMWPQFRPDIEEALNTEKDDGLQRELFLLAEYLSYE
ncbi:hypothetical protein EST62_05725 [Chlorobaculum sp. 24CR]|uniref:hypothetical protein n=1 Tax=Chlorobaculum sp. 24CR TaxID=2508878 RepID=UPI00100B3423|nr:hypothetical protein [Chlorobaculum sp. 24CR]RXK87839.1 hypothetical protein EST62_05725 [Chlorobaculum sp. 24CR]